MPHLLEGEVEDSRLADLEAENREFREEIMRLRRDNARLQADTTRALGALRRQLTPLYKALQAVFGELDAVGDAGDVGGETVAPGVDNRQKAVYESWKTRLPGGCGKVIDALLLHREMNTQQLAIACGMHRTSIPKLVYQLNKAGLVNKSGGRISLKPLA